MSSEQPDSPNVGPASSLPTIAPKEKEVRKSTHFSDLKASGSPHDVQTTNPPPAPIGSSDRYILSAFHARGGMGEVWRCRDASIGREVALKRLNANRAEARDRFLCEAQITGQLEHPSIVPVHDIGFDDNGQPFYVMKLVRGQTLKAAIDDFHAGPETSGDNPLNTKEPKPVKLMRLLKVFLDLCHAVAYAHSRGVIHRDLKPDNVMLGPFGETVVLDWGLAKFKDQPNQPLADHSAPPALSGSSAQTQDGSILGSPLYMPPEMAEGHTADADQRTDVYLLGATLYEILTGRPPRHGASRDELLELARTTPPPPPRDIVSDTPRPLEAICLKAMSRSPAHRFGTASALADDVQRYLAGEPLLAYKEPLWMRTWRWSRRHRTALARAAIALIVAVSLVAVVLFYRHARDVVAREEARTKLQHVRHLIDDARFYAASMDAPTETVLYYDPVRADELQRQTLAATAEWGTSLERLPLPDERASLRHQLQQLAAHLDAVKNAAASIPSPATRSQTSADDLFLQAERFRLQSNSIAPVDNNEDHRQRLSRAISLYEIALKIEPAHYWSRLQLGRCYLASGRNAEALQTLSCCIALRPDVPAAYSSRALALALSSRFQDAHDDLDRALALAPGWLPARLNRGVVFRLQDDLPRAAAEYDLLLAMPNPPTEAYYYRAQIFLHDDQPAKAINLLNPLLKARPQCLPGYLLRAQALLMLDSPTEALLDLDHLIAPATQSTFRNAARGHLLRELVSDLSAAHQMAPLDLAISELAKATSSDRSTAGVWRDFGIVLHRRGRAAAAIAAFSHAIDLEPDNAQLLIDRGWSYESADDVANAHSDFLRALKLAPTQPEALAGSGYVEARLHQPLASQRHASLALLHGSDNYLILHNVACIYARLSEPDPTGAAVLEDTAVDLLKRAVKLWRTKLAGPNELELIRGEVAFGPSLRARPDFADLFNR